MLVSLISSMKQHCPPPLKSMSWAPRPVPSPLSKCKKLHMLLLRGQLLKLLATELEGWAQPSSIKRSDRTTRNQEDLSFLFNAEQYFLGPLNSFSNSEMERKPLKNSLHHTHTEQLSAVHVPQSSYQLVKH